MESFQKYHLICSTGNKPFYQWVWCMEEFEILSSFNEQSGLKSKFKWLQSSICTSTSIWSKPPLLLLSFSLITITIITITLLLHYYYISLHWFTLHYITLGYITLLLHYYYIIITITNHYYYNHSLSIMHILVIHHAWIRILLSDVCSLLHYQSPWSSEQLNIKMMATLST